MSLNKKKEFSVSAISASPKVFFESLESFESSAVSRVHIDIMDGHFVPRLGLYPEFVSEVRANTSMNIDIHMMVEKPELYLDLFLKSGATRIVPHLECSLHPHRLMDEVKSSDAEFGFAINPLTDFSALKYCLKDLDVITIMAINPGIIGHQYIPFIHSKLIELKNFLRDTEFTGQIEVDGGVTFDNLLDIYKSGADLLVGGAGTIFHKSASVQDNLAKLEALLGGSK